MNRIALTLVLGGLAMVGPFATDTYLPSFPSMASHYGIHEVMMQQTLSVYLIAYAAMTLLYGPLSDAYGRRPIILISLLLFAIGSIGAMVAPTFEWLLLCRVIQGMSAGAGFVVGQAVVRDLLQGASAQQMMSHIMMVFGLAPAIAPIIGGQLDVSFGWQANFLLLAGFSALLFLLTHIYLPESLPPAERHQLAFKALIQKYQQAFTHQRYMLGVCATAFAFGGMGLYIASAADLVVNIWQLPSTGFGWLFIPMIGGMIVGSGFGAKLAHSMTPKKLMRTAYTIMLVAAVANIVYCSLTPASVPWAVLPVFAYTFGLALLLPVMSIAAQALLPNMRGMAASVQGSVQMLVFAFMAGLLSPMLFGSAIQLAIAVFMCTVASLACTWRFWSLDQAK